MIGTRLRGRFRIDEALGRGVDASTYLGWDEQADTRCVVKVLVVAGASAPEALVRFEREAAVLRSLAFPRIPSFVDAFTEDDAEGRPRMVLVYAFVEGESVLSRIRAHQRFTEAECWAVAQDAAEALLYLHGLTPPVLHRDIKPGNLVVDGDGRTWLIDFGAAQDRMFGGLTRAGDVVGTFGYMPVEQLEGRATAASDVYALGMTLFHMLTHLEPWTVDKRDGRIDVRAHVSSVGMCSFLERLLAPEPDARPVGEALLEAIRSSRDEVAPAQPAVREERRAPRMGLMIAITTCLLAGFGGLAAYIVLLQVPERFVAPAPTPAPAVSPAREPPDAAEELGAPVPNPPPLLDFDPTWSGCHGDVTPAPADAPLAVAIREGKHDRLKTLLAGGPDLTRVYGGLCRPPLVIAAQRGGEPMVRLLLDAGAPIDARDEPARTALSWAAGGCPACARRLIEGGADLEVVDSLRQTPLYYAASYGRAEVVQALLARGVDPNRGGQQSLTPLMRASHHGHAEVVDLLLRGGARLDYTDVSRWTALHHAAIGGHRRVVNALRRAGARVDAFSAAALGDMDRLERYLESPGTVDDRLGDTPLLTFAAGAGQTTVVRMLLERGATVDARGKSGRTPLIAAAYAGHIEVARQLLDAGANPDPGEHPSWRSPLEAAKTESRSPELAALLEGHLKRRNAAGVGGSTG